MREAIQVDRALDYIESNLLSSAGDKQPLSSSLSQFFKAHKNMGSRDRRIFSTLVYSYARLGNALQGMSIKERLAISVFLNQDEVMPIYEHLLQDYSNLRSNIQAELDTKLTILQREFSEFKLRDVVGESNRLSSGLDGDEWAKSHLNQPDLWVRVREPYKDLVQSEFLKCGLLSRVDSHNSLAWALPNRTNLETLESFRNGWLEVQDLSSQQTKDLLSCGEGEAWWDACCGAGGKSLMLLDNFPGVELYLSDRRESILKEAKKRLRRSKLIAKDIKKCDLLKEDFPFKHKMDGIVLDVPCSGSGTWARTPEWLLRQVSVSKYAEIQYALASKVISALKPSGQLIYITCSIFYEENEAVVEKLINRTGLRLEKSKLINGMDSKADSLFVAKMILE